MFTNMLKGASRPLLVSGALGAVGSAVWFSSVKARFYAHMSTTPPKSFNYMQDEPDEKTYGYSSPVVAYFQNLSAMRGLIFVYQSFPVAVLALVSKLLSRRGKLWISVPLWCYYLYDRGESWFEFDLLLVKLQLVEGDPTRAVVTKGLFWPREYTIKIDECRQTHRYAHPGHRMNYFQALTS